MAAFRAVLVSLVWLALKMRDTPLLVQGLMPISSLEVIGRQPQEHSSCGFGHLIPEFYVLGAKNAATSSLYEDLRRSGVEAAPRDRVKEWQFFFKHDLLTDEDQLFRKWLHRLPRCSGQRRRVLADYSVTNLFSVQLPFDFEWSPKYGYTKGVKEPSKWATPRHISHLHEMAGAGASTRPPKFVVMLRDPLARLQSEYYHTLPLRNCRGCMAKNNFVDSFTLNVELLRHMQMSDWFWKSFYARQIESFAKEFNASQFMFVPNKEYFAIDPLGFSAALLSWLELPDAQPWHKASHVNRHPKPQLDAELPLDHPARVAYQALMEPECQRLVQLLSRLHMRGAVLAGYTGPSGDEAAVRSWLESGW